MKPAKVNKRINAKQTIEQIARIGPETLGVAMMTSSFVGLVFTIQFCKEFSKVGLKNVIGGLLGLAFAERIDSRHMRHRPRRSRWFSYCG